VCTCLLSAVLLWPMFACCTMVGNPWYMLTKGNVYATRTARD
jgi:hypothetical protein